MLSSVNVPQVLLALYMFCTVQVEDIKKISEYVAQLRRVGKGHGKIQSAEDIIYVWIGDSGAISIGIPSFGCRRVAFRSGAFR